MPQKEKKTKKINQKSDFSLDQTYSDSSIVYSCENCEMYIFSSNYLLDENPDGYLGFSESIYPLSIRIGSYNEKILFQVSCPSCKAKLGLMSIDSSLLSKKKFYIHNTRLKKSPKSCFFEKNNF